MIHNYCEYIYIYIYQLEHTFQTIATFNLFLLLLFNYFRHRKGEGREEVEKEGE